MATVFNGLGSMATIMILTMLLVLLAMSIDLVSGLYKAKQRGEVRSSWALKRSVSKFIMYEGGLLIAACVDTLIHVCHFMELFNLKILIGVPVVTCIVGIFLLVVEFISVREKADKKTKTEMACIEYAIGKVANKDEIINAIADIVKKSIEKSVNKK